MLLLRDSDMWIVTPHTDDCYHRTEVRGTWLRAGVRDIIETEYFEHRKPPIEITDTLQAKLCTAYTRHRLGEKIRWYLQGAYRKNYGGGGMSMTMEEFTTLLDAWPRSSDSPDEVILLD